MSRLLPLLALVLAASASSQPLASPPAACAGPSYVAHVHPTGFAFGVVVGETGETVVPREWAAREGAEGELGVALLREAEARTVWRGLMLAGVTTTAAIALLPADVLPDGARIGIASAGIGLTMVGGARVLRSDRSVSQAVGRYNQALVRGQ